MNSHTEFSYYAGRLPSCDAWGLVKLEAGNISILDGSGISGVYDVQNYTEQGVFGVSFSNSFVFRSGYYVVLMTPEVKNDTYDTKIQNEYNVVALKEPRESLIDINNANSDNDSTAWLIGLSSGFKFQTLSPTSPDGIFSGGDPGDMNVHLSAFCFGTDGRTGAANGGVTGGTYDVSSGYAGYGLSGATYYSAIGIQDSKRTCTAYGTIVIPPSKGSGNNVIAYLESSYNIRGVSLSKSGIFDISFSRPLNSTNYCVFVSGEYETPNESVYDTSSSPDAPFGEGQEPSLFLVRAGKNNDYKTTSKFRIESWRKTMQTDSTGWTHSGYITNKGLTEKIHFMVFGGGTYGQP